MRAKIFILVLICFFVLVSCKKIENPHSPPLINPLLPIISFTAEPNQILGGEVTLLSWSVVNGVSATLSDGEDIWRVNLEDTRAMYPRETTTYILAASNQHGSTQRQAKVEVEVSANVIFDGTVSLQRPSSRISAWGNLRNPGNATAINIVFHVKLFDPEGNELAHLTHLFIHPYYGSSRLEAGQSCQIECLWTISESICNQIDEYTHSWKDEYATWDNE